MYTMIYYINKLFPKLAVRLAEHYFPIYEFETPHDLSEKRWAEMFSDICEACTSPDRYDDHTHGRYI